MEFFEVIPKVRALQIRLPSAKQNEKFESCLEKFSGNTLVELINILGSELNPKSVEIIAKNLVNSDLYEYMVSAPEDIPSTLEHLGYTDIPAACCVAILKARFERDQAVVRRIFEKLQNFAFSTGDQDEKNESLVDFISDFGLSRMALRKSILALMSPKRSMGAGSKKISQILKEAGSDKCQREILFIAEIMRPRGRPFRLLSSYEEVFDLQPEKFIYLPVVMDGVCPTPIHESHVPYFLNALLGQSLPDQVTGFKALLEIAHFRGWQIERDIKKSLGAHLHSLFHERLEGAVQERLVSSFLEENHTSFSKHAASIAFPELKNATLFRNEADRLILPNLVSTGFSTAATTAKPMSPEAKEALKLELRNPLAIDEALHFGFCEESELELPYILRFLRYRELLPFDFDVCGDAVALLISTDTPRRCFVSEGDIEKFVAHQEFKKDFLGAMLWSSIKIDGRLSDDADYRFLRAVEAYALNEKGGDLVSTFESLGARHPQVAVRLIKLLTPRRLQKCYMLISSYSEVNSTHRKLLEVAARITGDVGLIMQADQIILDEKLASVRAHIDSSRIYVEEVLFQDWVMENIWPSIELVRKQVFLILPGDSENLSTAEIASLIKGGADVLGKISDVIQEVFLNDQLKNTYDTFCRDHYFGVDSFLGRRIRHNATHGLLLGQLDEILNRHVSQNNEYDWEMHELYHQWKRSYLDYVDNLVNDLFRFRSNDYPRGLMTTEVDTSSEKFKSMATDVIAQVITRSEVDVVLRVLTSGCWGLLDPQLKKIRNFLKNDFSKSTMQLLDESFRNSSLPCRELHNDLKVTLLGKIERLSSWFSPFNPSETSLSLGDLSQLIWSESEDFAPTAELKIGGNACETLVVGGQSRILYDCLHVLLVNAAKHGGDKKEVHLNFSSENVDKFGANELTVRVSSFLEVDSANSNVNSEKFSKMMTVLKEENLSKKAMIVQGYSGLRKLRYLIYRMQREDRITLSWHNNFVSVAFSIPIEFARKEVESD